MNIIIAVILGAIQGLTEFLPVSSSGHLVFFQKILEKIYGEAETELIFGNNALFFDTMLHLGTLAAVFAVLWKDILAILKRIFQPLTAFLIIATVPTVFFALILRKPLEQAFETGRFLGISFLITSLLMVIAELLAKRAANKTENPVEKQSETENNASAGLKKDGEMNWLDALVVGIMQAIAIVPGISRSGATLSGALARGLNRDFAARFSFLLSIPAILGAAVFQLKDLLKSDGAALAGGGIGAAAIVLGTLTAAVVGFFAVRFMLKIVREKSLWGFAIYTAALGLLVLIDQLGTRLVF